ncbi:MAG: hypothetical protein IPM59_08840 [Chloracidobacterium sp.]|nr:hypothetical protein [Chloracidobacterium sp.]
MDALKLHLLLNYYPAIGMVIGSLVLAAGWWRNRARTQRFGIKVVLVTVAVAIAVAFTGEFAGLAAEPSAGPRANALNAHKLSATAASVTALVAGIFGLVALIRGRADAERPKRLYAIAMIFAIVSSVLFIATIFKGRQVKWADKNATQINRPSKLENKLWHA